MFWNRFFKPSFVLMLIIVALHWVGSIYSFYYILDWYDIVMHFLGGAWVVLFSLWVLNTQYAKKLSGLSSFLHLLAIVLVVGVLWEALEIYMGFTAFADPRYWFDTPMDLLMDLLGGGYGAFLYRKTLRIN
jgi:hypothetical protein